MSPFSPLTFSRPLFFSTPVYPPLSPLLPPSTVSLFWILYTQNSKIYLINFKFVVKELRREERLSDTGVCVSLRINQDDCHYLGVGNALLNVLRFCVETTFVWEKRNRRKWYRMGEVIDGNGRWHRKKNQNQEPFSLYIDPIIKNFIKKKRKRTCLTGGWGKKISIDNGLSPNHDKIVLTFLLSSWLLCQFIFPEGSLRGWSDTWTSYPPRNPSSTTNVVPPRTREDKDTPLDPKSDTLRRDNCPWGQRNDSQKKNGLFKTKRVGGYTSTRITKDQFTVLWPKIDLTPLSVCYDYKSNSIDYP